MNNLFYVLVFVGIIGIASWLVGDRTVTTSQELSATEFVQYIEDDKISEFSIQPKGGVYNVKGKLKKGQKVKVENKDFFSFGSGDKKTNEVTAVILQNDAVISDVYNAVKEHNIKMKPIEEPAPSIWPSLILTFLPVLMIGGLFFYMTNPGGQGGAGGRNAMNFGRSRAKETDSKKSTVRFSDVAGADEEKQELVEIVEFLKDPRRFSKLGARIPAGVLLEGPPGTGKTLLAKAVAGEAGVPFFSISGSEFVEMFVGVGASRVRDLFENAKKAAPSIIFIDEIDAVGRQRGAGMGGGHDEREQTLNQLLVEMDGFTGNEGVIVIAATNRSDVLDPALLRPGRFDRRILVGKPDIKGREAILKVHARNKPLAEDINLKLIAKQTPGFSGADLENLLNEAALVAARRNSQRIEEVDLDEAHDRVIAGPAKKDRFISETEREMIAHHEAGHTVVGLVLGDARVVHKVTIVPRGRAGGYAIMLPREDRFLMTKKDLTEQIAGLLGGRAAEEVFFNSQSSGASNDFEQATQIARAMVTEYGMSEKLGPVQYEGGGQVFLGRDYAQHQVYSDRIAYEIDQEVKRFLNEGMEEATRIVTEHAEQLKLIAQHLLKYETLNEIEIKSLFETGKMPSRDESGDEYPREETANEKDAAGTSYEAIKNAQDQSLKEREQNLEKREQHTHNNSSRADHITDKKAGNMPEEEALNDLEKEHSKNSIDEEIKD